VKKFDCVLPFATFAGKGRRKRGMKQAVPSASGSEKV
jgi:hypothetical protein